MNDTTEQTPPEPLNNEIEVDEEKIFIPQSGFPFPEQEIDLNAVFPNEESDLNDLFPDEEIRRLLKKVQRNKKDLHTMTDRFTDEDWGGNALTDGEPTQPSNTED
jgi:hypothetical protein